MNERHAENRLKGIRKAAGAALLTVSLAACGDNQPATQTPVLPTEQPTPTMVMPSASPEITPIPTPTPEITPKPVVISEFIDEIIAEGKADGFPKISATSLKESITRALEADPEAATTIADPRINKTVSENLNNVVKDCLNKDTKTVVRTAGCAGVGEQAIFAYNVNKNPVFLDVLNNIINYSENNFSGNALDYIINTIKAYNP